MLKDILSVVDSVRVVLDGLDECEDVVRKDILATMIEIQKTKGHTCKILISSRPDSSLDRDVRNKTTIDLRGETDQGIRAYVKYEVERLGSYFGALDEDLSKSLEALMSSKADGKPNPLTFCRVSQCPRFPNLASISIREHLVAIKP